MWFFSFFFFNDTATTEIYTLSLHDALPIFPGEFAPQPVYAPALVGFLGDTDAGYWQTADAGPAVGWFPPGPGEVYWPNYTPDPTYIPNLNMTTLPPPPIPPMPTPPPPRPPPPPPAPAQ